MLIQLRRGNEADLPILESGEPAFTTDTEKLYIGTGSENTLVSDQTYTHIQITPSTEWIIQLPAGFKKYPSILITDSAGTMVQGDANYNETTGEVTLSFAAAFAGQAHFN
ncbi:hypothetical protein [Acetobacterium wieringae]|uniref:Major tropism determinant N-terminal domain-containing protein n=1 Tax=Acetobacterium wieringae TaxID=52694 RepID=A0A1F2PCV8_9FIRM|nr:hypothetical protein [Acetobacterium wieringae]OFV69250.1 hypothetical protein ACWI_32940 [Acetobacterium wieringae]